MLLPLLLLCTVQGSLKSAQQIFASSSPSVVSVTVNSADGARQGTGFLADYGFIITCAHVVKDSTSVSVHFSNGIDLDAMVYSVGGGDIAILKAERPLSTKKLTICYDDPPALPGEKIFVLGSPEGLNETISEGIVSGWRGDNPLIREETLQITAPISPGSSGSPVFNERGEVVGIVTSYLSEGQALNFAASSLTIVSAITDTPEFDKDLEKSAERAEREPVVTFLHGNYWGNVIIDGKPYRYNFFRKPTKAVLEQEALDAKAEAQFRATRATVAIHNPRPYSYRVKLADGSQWRVDSISTLSEAEAFKWADRYEKNLIQLWKSASSKPD